MPSAWVQALLMHFSHLLQVHFYGLHKGEDICLHVDATLFVVHHQANEDVLNTLLFPVGVKHYEDGSSFTVIGWPVAHGLKGIILY